MRSFAMETRPPPVGASPAKETDRDGGDIATIKADVAALCSGTDASQEASVRPDPIDLAMLESFPASDPPGWLGITAGTPASS